MVPCCVEPYQCPPTSMHPRRRKRLQVAPLIMICLWAHGVGMAAASGYYDNNRLNIMGWVRGGADGRPRSRLIFQDDQGKSEDKLTLVYGSVDPDTSSNNYRIAIRQHNLAEERYMLEARLNCFSFRGGNYQLARDTVVQSGTQTKWFFNGRRIRKHSSELYRRTLEGRGKPVLTLRVRPQNQFNDYEELSGNYSCSVFRKSSGEKLFESHIEVKIVLTQLYEPRISNHHFDMDVPARGLTWAQVSWWNGTADAYELRITVSNQGRDRELRVGQPGPQGVLNITGLREHTYYSMEARMSRRSPSGEGRTWTHDTPRYSGQGFILTDRHASIGCTRYSVPAVVGTTVGVTCYVYGWPRPQIVMHHFTGEMVNVSKSFQTRLTLRWSNVSLQHHGTEPTLIAIFNKYNTARVIIHLTVHCRPLVPPANGQAWPEKGQPTPTQVICNPGYHLVGSSQLHCVRNEGSEPVWSGDPPKCLPIQQPSVRMNVTRLRLVPHEPVTIVCHCAGVPQPVISVSLVCPEEKTIVEENLTGGRHPSSAQPRMQVEDTARNGTLITLSTTENLNGLFKLSCVGWSIYGTARDTVEIM